MASIYTPSTGFYDSLTRFNITTSYQDLMWLLPSLLLGVDKKGTIKYVNRLWSVKLGYQPTEMLGKNFIEFVVEGNKTQEEFENVKESHEYDNLFINQYRCKDGSIVEIEWSSFYIPSTLLTWGLGAIRTKIKERTNE